MSCPPSIHRDHVRRIATRETEQMASSSLPILVLSALLLTLSVSRSRPASPHSGYRSISLPSSYPTTVSVIDFGATGDGKTYDTAAIQSAINFVSSSGGGTVRFPPGHDFLTATVFLRSRVVLEVDDGARLLAGTREEDYPPERERWYLVLAEGEWDVGIKGGGEINGQGGEFVVREDPRKNVMVSWNSTGKCQGDECRPRLIGFLDSVRVTVDGVNLVQPAYWCLHLVRCTDTVINDVSIYGDFDSPNNDGIDVEDSNNTVITRCHIDTGDDGICPKSSTGPVHNLKVMDCWIRTKSCAIKLGSASWFDFKNLHFDNIAIVDSHRGLGMQIRDGGNVSDVTFSNIKMSTRYYDPWWWGRAEPIYITTCPRDSTSKVGSISNLLFVNISAVSENGVFLAGSQGGLLSSFKFKDVNLTYKRWTNYNDGLVDYRPGCQGLVHHSTAGIMMEYVSGVELDNVNMRWSTRCLKGWNNPLQFRPNTISQLSFHDLYSDVY